MRIRLIATTALAALALTACGGNDPVTVDQPSTSTTEPPSAPDTTAAPDATPTTDPEVETPGAAPTGDVPGKSATGEVVYADGELVAGVPRVKDYSSECFDLVEPVRAMFASPDFVGDRLGARLDAAIDGCSFVEYYNFQVLELDPYFEAHGVEVVEDGEQPGA